jgi:hypothetical protein
MNPSQPVWGVVFGALATGSAACAALSGLGDLARSDDAEAGLMDASDGR